MSISRWDPWSNPGSHHEPMGRMLRESYVPGQSGFGRGGMPIDVRDQDDAYIIRAQMPGLRPEDIDVRVTGDQVRICGETNEDREMPEHGQEHGQQQGRWLLRERSVARYDRVLTLPSPVRADQADADYEHGVLTLRLPRAQSSRTRSIPVRSGQSQAAGQPGTEVPVSGGTRDESAHGEREFPLVEGAASPAVQSTNPPPARGPVGGGGPAPAYATVGSVERRTAPAEGSYAGSVDMTGGTAPPESRPVGRGEVREGMEVVGPQGGHVGSVKAVREHDFLVDRSMQRDVYVPYTAVMSVSGTRTVISVSPLQVDNMGWQAPDLKV